MFFHDHRDTDFCGVCAEWPVWARYLSTQLTEMRTLMSAEQDHINQAVADINAAVASLNGAVVQPVALDLTGLDQAVATAQADVAALPVVPVA